MLILGDYQEEMAKMPAASFDMILSDPPYGYTQGAWDSVINLGELWASIKRAAKPGAPIVLFGANPFAARLICSNEKAFRYEWVWKKNMSTGFLNAKKRPLVQHEYCLVFCDKTPPYFPVLGDQKPRDYRGVRKASPGQIYGSCSKPSGSANVTTTYPKSVLPFATDKGFHPTQKPVKLLEYMLSTYVKPGARVLDMFMGSGSTGVACKSFGAEFTGIERDQGFFDVATKRVEEAL